VEVEPVLSVQTAAAPQAVTVERGNLLRCKQAAHKRMVAVVEATPRIPAQAVQVVAVLARHPVLARQAFLEPLTRAVEVVGLTPLREPLPAVQVAQGSSWYARSSVALLRVS
tara:strand:- start:746 stop:1081 length:336 start_codon:yes stop_codon:yes gene_type:complete